MAWYNQQRLNTFTKLQVPFKTHFSLDDAKDLKKFLSRQHLEICKAHCMSPECLFHTPYTLQKAFLKLKAKL